ncbi:MAG: helix-turn-helix transcriptional regulator, partial [Planctomycetes bacterium]|nr:helix-turn-helix transcriptional regulator [Planctomycetota bacterium]
MNPTTALSLPSLIEESLRLEYVEGAVSLVAPGYSTGWRSLPFTVVAQWRRGPVRLELLGEAASTVDDACLLVIPATVRHCVTTLAARGAECRWAHVHASVLGAHDLVALLALPMVHPRSVGEDIGRTCADISALPAPGSDVVAITQRKAAHLRLLAQVVALAPEGGRAREALQRSERLLPALQHMREHSAEPITRDQLATLTGLSPSRFHWVFSDVMGIAPVGYLRRLRMQQAQQLLVATDLPVGRIGERVGYPD